MALFEYEQQLADLQNKYAADKAAQEYGRFLSQQRYSRDNYNMKQNFQTRFPQMTGGLARRGFGSQVGSGRVGADVGQMVNQFNTAQGQLAQSQATDEGYFQTQQANQESAYQAAVLRLMEQMKATQAQQNPFATYQAVYGAK